MEIQPQHVDPIARLLLTIRPDWSLHYTTEAVRKMRGINPDLERILAAAVRGACSPRIAKPDVLAMTGDHWKTPAAEPTGPTRPLFRCPRCGRIDHDAAEDCHPPPVTDFNAIYARVAELRAAHAEARSRRIDTDAARRQARQGTDETRTT